MAKKKRRSKRSSKGSASKQGTSGLAISSMVLGIVALLLCWVPGLGSILSMLAFILGLVGLNQIKNNKRLTGKGMAISGIVLGSIAFMFSLFVIIAILGADSINVEQENEIIENIEQSGDQLNEYIFEMNDDTRNRRFADAMGKLERANLQLDELVLLVASYERLTYDYKEDDRVELNILNYNRNLDEQRESLILAEKELNSLRKADHTLESIKVVEEQISDLRREININLENDHIGSARGNINTYIAAVAKYKEHTSDYLGELSKVSNVDYSSDEKHFKENIKIYDNNIRIYNANVPK